MSKDLKVKIGADASPFNKAVNKVIGWTKKLGNSFKNIITHPLSLFAQLGLTVRALGQYAMQAARDFRAFQHQLAQINTIAKLSRSELKTLGNELVELSKKYGFSISDVAKGAYNALSASIPADKLISFMNVAGRAAIAGVTGMKTSIDALTSVINGYQLNVNKTERVSDIFFETIRLGKTTFAELNESIGKVIPIAASAGISFAEVSAALATMTRQGLNTEMSSTALRGAIAELLAPNEKLKVILAQITKEQDVLHWSALGLQRTLDLVAKSVNNDATKMSELFGNIRALTGVLQMVGDNARMAARDLDLVTNSVGAMDKAFAETSSTEQTAMDRFKEKFAEFKRDIGEEVTPLQTWLAERGSNLIDAFRAIGKAAKSATERIAKTKRAWDDFMIRIWGVYVVKLGGGIFDTINSVVGKIEEAKKKVKEAKALVEEIKSIKAQYKYLGELSPKEQKYLDEGGYNPEELKKRYSVIQKAREQQKEEEKAAREEAEKQQKTIDDMTEELNQQLRLQKMIMEGKEREAKIEEELLKIRKRANRELTEQEVANISKVVGESYDLSQRGKNWTGNALPPVQPEIISDSLRRVGGYHGGSANESLIDVSKKTLSEIEDINSRIMIIENKIGTPASNKGVFR
jgi:TP901 family phage tail tape measure protein